jgi:FKBP-type peptidyl-prolyl cis-trans isomerase (trigger factor)
MDKIKRVYHMHITKELCRWYYNKTNKYLDLNYMIIMNNILDNLFYKEKLGIDNKTTFIKMLGRDNQKLK